MNMGPAAPWLSIHRFGSMAESFARGAAFAREGWWDLSSPTPLLGCSLLDCVSQRCPSNIVARMVGSCNHQN